MNRKQRAEALRRRDVYLRALKRIADGHGYFSCWSVDYVAQGDSSFRSAYDYMFTAPGSRSLLATDIARACNEDPEAEYEFRLTMLCFAAAMAETGDL